MSTADRDPFVGDATHGRELGEAGSDPRRPRTVRGLAWSRIAAFAVVIGLLRSGATGTSFSNDPARWRSWWSGWIHKIERLTVGQPQHSFTGVLAGSTFAPLPGRCSSRRTCRSFGGPCWCPIRRVQSTSRRTGPQCLCAITSAHDDRNDPSSSASEAQTYRRSISRQRARQDLQLRSARPRGRRSSSARRAGP